MTNRFRGEVEARIAGRPVALCLTLGALAEIETALGASSLAELAGRLARLKASELVAVLGALARGGGMALTDSEVGGWPADLTGALAAINQAFAAATPSAAPVEGEAARPTTAATGGPSTWPSP